MAAKTAKEVFNMKMKEKMKTKHFCNAVMTALIAVIFSVLASCASAGVTGDPTVAQLAAQLAADIDAIEAGKATVSGDTVMLTGGVRLTTALTVPEGVTLDLTKETLQLANNAIFTVNGTVHAKAEGVNIDSAIATPATINGSGNISLKSKGRLLVIRDGKKLILDGVTLVGLADNSNRLVELGEGGELVMKSGAITGNTNTEEFANGGGVNVIGTFTMEGGKISGNTAKGVRTANGGGVFVSGGSTFTMTGGTISDNSTDYVNGGGGGGVAVASATFTMSGGTISGNSSTARNGEGGGGVRVFNSATFTMEGGAIFGNASENGGGVHVRNRSTFTMQGGRIQGGTDSDGFTKNTDTNSDGSSALYVHNSSTTAKWGTDGTYTKGGVSQTGGTDIVELKHLSQEDWDWGGGTDDTLIAMPGE
jgi:hypothetical protein